MTGRARRARWWALALLAALVAPVLADERETFLLMSILVLAVFATSYNVLLGYTGMVSFAHAAYYGVGAYTVALLWFHQDVPVLVGLALCPLAAGLFALVTGLIAMRAVRLYFALLTLALGQIVYLVAFQWRSVTKGDDGIHGIAVPSFLEGTNARYYFLLAVAAVAIVLMSIAMAAPFGAALRAIRENPERASFLGLDVKRYQLAAYTVAGTFAGLAGGMFAIVDRSAYPSLLHWTTGAEPIYVTLIGGLNVFAGPAVGAVIYAFLEDATTRRFEYWGTVLGFVLLAIILFMPGGVAEAMQRLGRRLGRKRGAAVDERSTDVPAADVRAVDVP
jgi:branched-chain amino acid transport system permease protein